FLWVMATNPAVSLPDSGFIREALARCPTVVASEVIADTDTTRLADILLPALAWGEKDGTVTNSERCISRQRALFPAPGEARADWRILCDVATRLGWGEDFAFARPADVFREYATMSALAGRHGKMFDLTDKADISDWDYEAMKPFQWGGEHPLKDGFPTPSGKAQLVPVSPPVEASDKNFPLRLNTGRYRDQWHTMTRTGLSPTLSQHRREPLLEVHPLDAAAQGLHDGGLARVLSARGTAVFRVALDDRQRPGEIFVPMHWTDAMSGEGRCNRLPGPATDPVSGQPGFKNIAARIEPVQPEWRAFLVTREVPGTPELLYWTRARVAGGWLFELAGEGAVDCDALLPEGERLEAADKARGMRRIAVRGKDGSLEAALFVTRSGELPPREWVASRLGDDEASPAELLAGRPSTPLPDRGPVVCVCHGIGEHEIVEAAGAGAETVAAVGEATCAGTNCGSCRPAIARLIEAALSMEREAAE
ncbi:MAG: molybdopterin-dependent oxidoreductase, partial [Novosphingobium sp.]|nr:molybdopterin-dependent oxidoreductase [Novosphingobium sp.]